MEFESKSSCLVFTWQLFQCNWYFFSYFTFEEYGSLFVTGTGVTHVLRFLSVWDFFYRLRYFTFRIIPWIFAASLLSSILPGIRTMDTLNIWIFILLFRSFFYFLTLIVFNTCLFLWFVSLYFFVPYSLFIVLYWYSGGKETHNSCVKSDFISTDVLGMAFTIKSQSGKTLLKQTCSQIVYTS